MASVTSYTAAASTERQVTALEAHLASLDQLNRELYNALDRAQKCADRLLGAEPSKLEGVNPKPPPSPADPPMVRKLDEMVRANADLANSIHSQLARIERL